MTCEVEFTDEFEQWWDSLNGEEQESVAAIVGLLEEIGANLPFPYSSGIQGSRFGQMRELRIQHKGRPFRILYAFDPRRVAILLIGGNKQGANDWYENYVTRADRLFELHLAELKKEGGK